MNTLDNYANAIAAVESDGSGGYGAVGPATRNGDKAYGRYQVMGYNVPSWTQAATGTALTPEQFLADPDAQDKTFKHHFGNLVNQYGNPQDAASAWFTGRPRSTGGTANDGYITGNEYVRRFNNALDGAPALTSTGSPMADQGALNTKQTLGNGVLGGMGPALQDAGSYLMGLSPYTKPPDANHSANWLKEAGPQVIDGGTDPLTGQKMLFTLRNGQLTPMGIGAAPGAGAPAGPGGAVTYSGSSMPNVSQLTQAISQHHEGKIDDDQLKKVAGPLLADYTDALARGDADPKNLGMRAGPMRPFAIMLAHALHPDMDFSEGMIDARRREVVNMANSNNVNTLAGAAASFSKVIQHGDEIQNAAERLEKYRPLGGKFNDVNWAQNYLKSHGSDTGFKAALNDYETAADAFSKESDRLMSQGHPTLTGQQEIRSRFNSDKSLAEKSAAVGRVLSLSHDVFDPLTYNNNYAFGRLGKPTEKKAEDFMSPATRKAWDDAQDRITKAMHQGGTPAPADKRPPLSSFLPK